MAAETEIWSGSPSQVTNLGTFVVCALLTLTGFGAIVAIPYAFWKYLVVKCQRYELTSQRLKYHSGVFNKTLDELELYRVRDTKFDQPFVQGLFGLGNVVLVSSDATSPVTTIRAVKEAGPLRERVRELVEERRDQKRVRIAEFE